MNKPVTIKNNNSDLSSLDNILEIREHVATEGWERYNLVFGTDFEVGERYVSPLRETADNPTAFLVNENGRWYDFVGQRGGDVIDLAKEVHHLSFKEAVKKLFGISLDNSGALEEHRELEEATNIEMQYIAEKLHEWALENSAVMEYLQKRGITEAIIRNSKIGFLRDLHELQNHLQEKEVSGDLIDISGLEGRIMFPYFDESGTNVLYFIARSMNDSTPKYKKMQRTNKSIIVNPLFGLETLSMIQEDVPGLILAEGVLDALTLKQCGYPVLASCGGCFSHAQQAELVSRIKRLQKRFPGLKVTIWFDYDPQTEVGQDSSEAMAKILLQNGINSYILTFTGPQKVDVNGLYMADKEAVSKVLKNSCSFLSFMADKIKKESEPEAAESMREEIIVAVRENPLKGLLQTFLQDSGLSPSEARARIKDAALKPQELAARMSKTFRFVRHREVIYMRHGRGYIHMNETLFHKECRCFLEKALGLNNVSCRTEDEFAAALNPRITLDNSIESARISADEAGYLKGVTEEKPLMLFKNGVLILGDDGPVLKNDRKLTYFSTMNFDYDYNANACYSLWLKQLELFLPDAAERALLQEFAGFLFYPDHRSIQAFLILIGSGANGKGTVVRTLEHMLGKDLCASFSLKSFSRPHDTALLVGKRLVSINEIDHREATSVAAIKTWTGGDTVQVNPKNRDLFSYLPSGKMIISTNTVPFLPDPSNGIDRRIIPLEFKHKITHQDGSIENKLKEEIAGILNWAIEGYYMLRDKKAWTEENLPASVLALRKDIRCENDPFSAWASDSLYEKKDESLNPTWAYENYRDYSRAEGRRAVLGLRVFCRRLKDHIGKEPSHGIQRAYSGWAVHPVRM